MVKVKVVGHRLVTDQYQFVPDASKPDARNYYKDEYLINDLEVLAVLKGEPSGKVIPAAAGPGGAGGGICLKTGDIYYTFLTNRREIVDPSRVVDDPVKQQVPAVYWIKNPEGQFPIKNGRVEFDPSFPSFREREFPGKYHGLPEPVFVEELKRALR